MPVNPRAVWGHMKIIKEEELHQTTLGQEEVRDRLEELLTYQSDIAEGNSMDYESELGSLEVARSRGLPIVTMSLYMAVDLLQMWTTVHKVQVDAVIDYPRELVSTQLDNAKLEGRVGILEGLVQDQMNVIDEWSGKLISIQAELHELRAFKERVIRSGEVPDTDY
jgi:hypothetical protein